VTDGPEVFVVVDTSAVIGYASSSIEVGEIIAEVTDQGGYIGVPVVCLTEASRQVGENKARRVEFITQHPRCIVLPVLASDWRYLAQLTRLLGRSDVAITLGAALDLECFVLTREPDSYTLPDAGELPIIGV
jgi:hypothetical protein